MCQDASSFAFPGVITTVPAAQRTLDFPNTVGHAGHFWHLWHLWHWSGLAGFLYALVAPAPLRAHSVVGTISTFLRSSSVLYELLRRLPKVLAKPAPYAVVAAHSYTLDVWVPQGLPGAPAAAAEAAQKAGSSTATAEAALRLRRGRGALQRAEP